MDWLFGERGKEDGKIRGVYICQQTGYSAHWFPDSPSNLTKLSGKSSLIRRVTALHKPSGVAFFTSCSLLLLFYSFALFPFSLSPPFRSINSISWYDIAILYISLYSWQLGERINLGILFKTLGVLLARTKLFQRCEIAAGVPLICFVRHCWAYQRRRQITCVSTASCWGFMLIEINNDHPKLKSSILEMIVANMQMGIFPAPAKSSTPDSKIIHRF